MPDAPTTRLIHHPYRPPEDFEGVMPGVFKASTVYFPNVAASRTDGWLDKSSYTYGLQGTPTSFVLEQRLAMLDGARRVLLTPGWRAALTLVAATLLSAGDEVLLPRGGGHGNGGLAADLFARWGVRCGLFDPACTGSLTTSLAAALTPSTRLVWLEVANAATQAVPDLVALVRTVRERAPQALMALDVSWGAGLAVRPFDLDGQAVDLTVHALERGVAEAIEAPMASVGCSDEALWRRLLWCHTRLGLGVGMNDAEAMLRGLPSLRLRHDAREVSARRLAQWCVQQPVFQQVLHPSLPACTGHAQWTQRCRTAGALLSVAVDARVPAPQVEAFVDALRCWQISAGWGGPVSQVTPFGLLCPRRCTSHGSGTLLRLSVGLERVDDLIGDLQRAMQRTGLSPPRSVTVEGDS